MYYNCIYSTCTIINCMYSTCTCLPLLRIMLIPIPMGYALVVWLCTPFSIPVVSTPWHKWIPCSTYIKSHRICWLWCNLIRMSTVHCSMVGCYKSSQQVAILADIGILIHYVVTLYLSTTTAHVYLDNNSYTYVHVNSLYISHSLFTFFPLSFKLHMYLLKILMETPN